MRYFEASLSRVNMKTGRRSGRWWVVGAAKFQNWLQTKALSPGAIYGMYGPARRLPWLWALPYRVAGRAINLGYRQTESALPVDIEARWAALAEADHARYLRGKS